MHAHVRTHIQTQGLGKTLTMLALMMVQGREVTAGRSDTPGGQAAKLAKAKAAKCKAKSKSKAAAEANCESTADREEAKESVEAAEVHASSHAYVCRGLGNLVVCPSHLVQHWYDQVQKHVKPDTLRKLRVWKVTKKPEHEQMTYKDLIEADVVIVSVQFFMVRRHGTCASVCIAQRWRRHLQKTCQNN